MDDAAVGDQLNEYVLRDGRRVTIRPIRSDDGERLRASHARLSPESRYRRFLAAKPELSRSDTQYLVEVDGWDHFALVATAPGPEAPIVAVARYIRLPHDPQAAEFAIVVGDAYQRQGLATELMSRLAQAAVMRGVDRFDATILADNHAIQKVAAKLATGPITRRSQGSLSEVEIELAAARGPTRSPSRPRLHPAVAVGRARPVGNADGDAGPAIIAA